ncbi:hypothetical protein JOM56_014472 [Amanita muscaria]
MSSSASEGYLTEKLGNARQALLASGYYLGTPEPRWEDKVTWKRIGKAERLVSVEDDVIATAAYKAFEESDQLGKAPNPPDPVMLSAVVHVSEEDYWLTSCGMWRGDSPVARTLADVKPTCVGVAPVHAVFAEDFRLVLENVNNLMEMSRAYDRRKGVIIGALEKSGALNREDGNVGGTSTPSTDSVSRVPVQYTIAQWPAFYSEAQEQLKTMVDTHRVNYLRAFDMHGNLIEPQDYRKHLQGALVQIHFTLTHWAIGGRSGDAPTDIYTADICNMRVLSPPPSYGMAVTPRKRKFHAKDPLTPDISPKKFRTFLQ